MIMKKAFKIALWALVAAFVVLTFFFLWRQSRPAPEIYELLQPEVRTVYQSSIATGINIVISRTSKRNKFYAIFF